jgi:putative DNA primase/helicase
VQSSFGSLSIEALRLPSVMALRGVSLSSARFLPLASKAQDCKISARPDANVLGEDAREPRFQCELLRRDVDSVIFDQELESVCGAHHKPAHDGESPKAAKARYLAELKTHPKPTAIVDSGNGLKLWRLAEPIGPDAFAQVEAASKAAILALGGMPGTQNVDRILRLPGTTNVPNATKRKAGRVECPANLISFNGATCALDAFPLPKANGRGYMNGHHTAANAGASIDFDNLPSVDIDTLPVTDRIRHMIRTGKDPENKLRDKSRSSAFWSVLLATVRAGCADGEIAAIMFDLPIGAHLRGQSNPRRKLEEQIDKARRQMRLKNERDEPKETPDVVCLADVVPQPIKWLWPQRFALGKLSLIAGHPGLGKSQLTLDLAARVSTGGEWPCRGGKAPRGNVIILSAEDDAADTIRPRLDAAGADPNHIHALQAIKQVDGDGRRSFDLTRDIEHLEQTIYEVGDVKLVIIDPISAYMGQPGKVDTHRNTDVRAILAPLQDLASRLGVAVIVISRLTKGGRDGALARVTGSGAFVAAARAAFIVEKEKDEDNKDTGRRLFLPAENNIGDDTTGFAYTIVMKPTATHGLHAPAIEWEDETVSITADEALAPASGEKSGGAFDARNFLKECLSNGPMPQKQIEAAAAQRGFTVDQLKYAKRRLGVEARKEGFGKDGAWAWAFPGATTLPGDDTPTPRRGKLIKIDFSGVKTRKKTCLDVREFSLDEGNVREFPPDEEY